MSSRSSHACGRRRGAITGLRGVVFVASVVCVAMSVACGSSERAKPPESERERTTPEPREPPPEPSSDPQWLQDPPVRWNDVSSPSNGLRPVSRAHLGEIETLYRVGELREEEAWLKLPVLWSNENPDEWARFELEHPFALADSGVARLNGRVVWLDLQTDEGRASLEHVSGPVALEHAGDIVDETLWRSVREIAQRVETGINAASSSTTDATLELAGEAPLRALFLWHSQVTDEGLAHLRERAELRELRLMGAQQISDAGVAHLADLSLVGLDLAMTKVTNEGIQHLAGMTDLALLDLSNTRVTAAVLRQLSAFAHLEDLALAGINLGVNDLRHLGELPLKRL
ncbi:MAG: hypothetical protein AAF368_16105, partial [Planctomycetota bacterium]